MSSAAAGRSWSSCRRAPSPEMEEKELSTLPSVSHKGVWLISSLPLHLDRPQDLLFWSIIQGSLLRRLLIVSFFVCFLSASLSASCPLLCPLLCLLVSPPAAEEILEKGRLGVGKGGSFFGERLRSLPSSIQLLLSPILLPLSKHIHMYIHFVSSRHFQSFHRLT